MAGHRWFQNYPSATTTLAWGGGREAGRRGQDARAGPDDVNCINDTHLNTVLEEAEVSAKRHTFRSSPGKGEDARSGGGAGSDETGPKYNGKFTANSKEVCWFFNSGQPHRADHLHPDGTCKRNHVCDKWVSNKGPGGVCKGCLLYTSPSPRD